MSQYRPLGLVGQGQYGQVYLAYSRSSAGLVALKALHSQRFPTRNFLRELRFLLGLNHPQIVRCHTLDYWQGRRCLVMDYGEGGTLRGLLEQENELPLLLALDLTADVLAGLEYIHGQGIIHCDIKPENILLRLTRQGWKAQISDLGVARIEAEVESAGHTGSPAYMAPERFYGQYSPCSDLYAVGILLFEMVMGARPFSGTPVQLMSAHLSQPLQITSALPFLVQALLRKSLTKLPQKRYQTAAEMAKAVQLAHDVLLAEGKQFYPLFPKSTTWNPAWQATIFYSLSHPLRQLVSVGEVVYGLESGVIWQFQAGDNSIATRQPLNTPNPVKHLVASLKDYWYQDQANQIYSSAFSLALALPWVLNQHESSRGQNSSLVWGVEGEGKWLALAPVSLNQPLTIVHLPSGRSYQCPLFPGESGQLQQIIPINSRYGLAIVAIDKGKFTQFYLFNRRGHVLLSTRLPMRLTQMTQARQDPWHFLALTPDQPQAVILMRLNLWQIQRIILNFCPHWVTATPWGYGIADQTTLACISVGGELLGGIRLKAPLTAMTATDTGFWVSSWDGQQGRLERVEFMEMGLDLIL